MSFEKHSGMSVLKQWLPKGDFALGTFGKTKRHICQSVCLQDGIMEPGGRWGADKVLHRREDPRPKKTTSRL